MKKLIFLISLILFSFSLIFGQSSSTKYPGTVVELYTAVAWTSPDNVKLNDNNPATVTLIGQASKCLKVTNFGFSIPSTAIIDSVVGGVYIKYTDLGDGVVYLSCNRLFYSDTKDSTLDIEGGTYITTGYALYRFNSTHVVTPTEANASTFGWSMNAADEGLDWGSDVSCDYMNMTIYYHESASTIRHRIVGYRKDEVLND